MSPARLPRMTDREVIESFVAFLAAHGRPGLVVTDWPEDHKDGEIDAVAGDLAIEHTSIDTLRVRKWLNVPAGIFFMRVAREDDTLPARIRERCDQKIKKLVPWHAAGKTTVLLL